MLLDYIVNISDTHLIMTSYLQTHSSEKWGLLVFCSGWF